MKILTISQFYKPDITAPAFRVTEMMDHLNMKGHEIEIITTYPHKNIISEINSSEKNVERIQLPDTENKGFLGYIYLYLSFFFKSLIKGIAVGRKQKPDVVWATSPPIFVGLSGWILAKLLGAGFALDIRDVWPDSAVAADQISGDGTAYIIGRKIEMFLYKNADIITCVAKPMKNYIKNYTVNDVHVVYNGVGNDELEDKKINLSSDILEKYSSDRNSKKILYAGNFGHVQQLEILIEAFSEINRDRLNENWEIFFLGGGVKKEYLVELVNAYKLGNQIHFLDPVPKEEVFNYLQSADVLFIHLKDSDVLRLTIPSKVFDYMLADRPLLAGIYGEGKGIIESVNGNKTFKSGHKDSLKQAIRELDNDISKKEYPNNASLVKNIYNRNRQSNKLEGILNQKFNL